jgi:hypothetical protein
MSASRTFTRAVSTSLLVAVTVGLAACSSSGGNGSPTLSSIQVTPANDQIPVGITQQFTAKGAYSDGTTGDLTAQVTWASATTAAASISPAGLATPGQPGSTVISATLGAVVGSTSLSVTAATLKSITLAPTNPSIAAGTTQQFAALGHFSNGDAHDVTQQATWTSGKPAAATIGPSGLAAGVAAGTTTISASLSGVTGTTILSVTSSTLQSILVTPASPQVAVGLTVPLKATGTFSDGTTQDLTGLATWSSASTAVATVAATGIVSGVLAGTSTITATFSGVSGSTLVTVGSSVLQSIVVTPAGQTIPVNGTLQMTATGHFSDSSTRDVTAQASWTANPATPVSVSITPAGLVTGVAVGTPQVMATLSGVSGTTNLTVGAAPAIPEPPPDVANYFQIMIDNRITSSVTPNFLVNANQMSLTSPLIINPTFLTGGGPNFSDWTAPVFQILDSTTGTFATSVVYPDDGYFTLDMLPLDASGQYRILKIPFLDPSDKTRSLGGSGHLTITLGAEAQTSIVQSADTKLYAFSLPDWNPASTTAGGQQAWDYVEFNCATQAVNGTPVCVINTTNVDFFFLGITVMARQPGVPYTSFGLDVSVPNAMASMLAALDALTGDYSSGKINSSTSGQFIRYLAPGHSFTSAATALDAQITASWNHYTQATLSYQVSGVQCTATNVSNVLQFTAPQAFSVAMPTTLEAVSATGPLDTGPLPPLVQNCVKYIAAYLNRGVFQDTSTWLTTAAYYPAGGTWNQYAAILHANFIQNLAYGFSYDDVPGAPQTNPSVGNATSTTLVLSDH